MISREDRIRGIVVQAELVEDLEAAWKRAIVERDKEIYEALMAGISERTLAAVTPLSRSFINKVRRTYGNPSTTAA